MNHGDVPTNAPYPALGLESTILGVYRHTPVTWDGSLSGGNAPDLYKPMFTTNTFTWFRNGTAAAGNTSTLMMPSWRLDPADFAITGMLPKFRICFQVIYQTVTEVPDSLSMSLYKINPASQQSLDAATAVGTSATLNSGFTSNSISHAESADFTLPSAGQWTLGMTIADATDPSVTIEFRGLGQLQYHWVAP